ncbi:MAG: hypothetical protein IKG22_09500 [Atopobiaceae bacterium]|nr:hypothetical protein [Atopobiaceae bacterium]
MTNTIQQALVAAGCTNDLIARYETLVGAGKHEESLQLLRCERCRLVEAMHEAQRPIDVMDWVIANVTSQSTPNKPTVNR